MSHYHHNEQARTEQARTEQARTAAKFVYIKLCRQGHLEAAQRVLRLLQDGRRTFGIGDADWTAALALEAENVFLTAYNLSRNGLSCCFIIV